MNSHLTISVSRLISRDFEDFLFFLVSSNPTGNIRLELVGGHSRCIHVHSMKRCPDMYYVDSTVHIEPELLDITKYAGRISLSFRGRGAVAGWGGWGGGWRVGILVLAQYFEILSVPARIRCTSLLLYAGSVSMELRTCSSRVKPLTSTECVPRRVQPRTSFRNTAP